MAILENTVYMAVGLLPHIQLEVLVIFVTLTVILCDDFKEKKLRLGESNFVIFENTQTQSAVELRFKPKSACKSHNFCDIEDCPWILATITNIYKVNGLDGVWWFRSDREKSITCITPIVTFWYKEG